MSPTALLPWLVVQAASLSQSSVPATGRHETILTLDAPAAVHLSARSGSGTACEVIDRVRGPFARAGAVGRTNCELDLLLDAGQYKVRVESPLKGKGLVALAATLFTELNPSPVQLANGATVDATLKPGQQLSFWLPMPARGVPYVRISGRHAGDVRLWRNGEWLEPLTFRRTVVTHTPGFPMHEWWLDQVLEAGDYKLVVYGRDSVTVTGSTVDDSVAVERGFRPGPAERSVSFTLPPSGVFALELPTNPVVASASLESPPEGAVQVQLADVAPLSPLSFTSTCTIAKGALVPECAARSFATPDRRVVLVRGPRGARGTLEWASAVNSDLGWLNTWRGGYYGAPSSSFTFSTGVPGRVIVATHDLPIDADAAPLGCQLEEFDTNNRTARIVARAMTKLEDGEALEKEFNYENGAIIWFELSAANRYRVRTEGGRKSRCEVYRHKPDGTLERLTQSKADDTPGCDHLLSLGKGEYQLQLFGGNPGIEKLVIREDSKRDLKRAVARSTCQLPPVELRQGRYRLLLTRIGNLSARGVTFTEVPVDISRPVHLSLEPRQTLELPLAAAAAFVAQAPGGARFGCKVQGAPGPVVSASCAVPAARAGDTLTLNNPGDHAVQVTLFRPVAPPPAAGPSSYSPALKPLPKLAAEQPTWFDFERSQTHSAMFEVDTPGLYNVTTLGLLATSCRLRTPVVDLVAQNAAGGRGRNCLIQTYLQKGRYLLSASTQGLSKGRGALFLLRKPAREFAGLGGEGESFFRVDANELVQQKLVVSKAGEYRLATTAQGASLSCRLDDQQGWPVEPVPSPCAGTRTLSAGTWLWTQLPLTVESMRRTSLERVREAVVLRGNRPHAVEAFTWYDAELGSDGKDEFTFTLEGEATLNVVLTQGMQGRVFLLEKGQPPKAVEVIPPQVTAFESGEAEAPEQDGEYQDARGEGEGWEGEGELGGDGEPDGSEAPVVAAAPSGPALRAAPPPPSGVKLTLPAGSYKLVTEHSKGDVGITYRLHFGSAVLLPGMARTLPVPTTLPLTIPRDGTLRLRTEGEADVRCRLFDEKRRLVLEGSENGADWNCALAEPLVKGRYTLVLESETQLGGETRLSVQLPPIEEQGAFADGQKLTLGKAVVQLSVPPGDAVQELVVKAAGKTPFSCAVVGPEGVVTRRSRVTDCSMLVLPKQEPWRLRLWTTDGTSAVSTSYKARALVTSGAEVAAGQALAASISKPGRYRTSPQAFCLRGRATGAFERCGPEVSLEAGPVVFSGFGTASVPVPLDEVRFPASATAAAFELSRAPHVQAITAAQPSLFLLSAQSGWGEAAPPACAFDGQGTVRERRELACFAVSRVGTEALARVWAATDAVVPATVLRRDVPLPQRVEALTPGRRKVTFSGVGAWGLPPGRARVEATLPKDTWGVLVDDGGNAVELCGPANDLRRCVVTGQGGRFVLVGAAGQAELTTVLLETAPTTVAFTGLYEDTPRTPGTVRLVVSAAEQERVVLVEGALRCTLVLASGERVAECRAKLPAKTAAELVIEHEVTALRALVHTPGREKWARLGIELPVVAGPALQPAVAVPLQQGRIDRTLVLTQRAVVRVAAESGVCGLFRANDLLVVHGDDTGCELVRVLNPGTYRLLVRPFANRAAPGSLRWLAEPVTTLSEGVGAESWLAPGEVRLFTFDTRGKGRVGFGVQAKSENLECAVYNDGYLPIGEGCHQYLTLDKGRFLLTVRNPNRPGASPIAVKPVLLGLAGDASEVPPEYLRDFFGRVGVAP